MNVEEIVIIKRKQGDKKKSDLEQKKTELMEDLVSLVRLEKSVEYKRLIQELFWKYRKKGLTPKEAWEKAKEEALIKVKD